LFWGIHDAVVGVRRAKKSVENYEFYEPDFIVAGRLRRRKQERLLMMMFIVDALSLLCAVAVKNCEVLISVLIRRAFKSSRSKKCGEMKRILINTNTIREKFILALPSLLQLFFASDINSSSRKLLISVWCVDRNNE